VVVAGQPSARSKDLDLVSKQNHVRNSTYPLRNSTAVFRSGALDLFLDQTEQFLEHLSVHLEDVVAFCRSVMLDRKRKHASIL
jgi:hypothetical protein